MNIRQLFLGLSFLPFLTSCGQNNKNSGDTRFVEKALSSPTTKEDARQFYNDGYRAFHSNDFPKAIDLYKKAIAIDPQYADAYDNCGLSYRRLGNLDSAETYYKKSINLNPKAMIAHANLAIVYTDKGNLNAALNEYNEIKKYNSNDPEAFYGAADIYFRMENVDKALENSLKALELYNPTNPQYAGDAEFYVGLAYYKKQDKQKAKTYMLKAMQHGTQVPESYLNEFGLK